MPKSPAERKAQQLPGSDLATVPGKWIPVSERAPVEFEAVIAFDGDQVYGEAMYSSDDGFTIDGYDPCDRLNLQNVTHWMPLPAAPQPQNAQQNIPEIIPDSSVIGWLRYDYQETFKKIGGPLFILGANDPSDAWGLRYIPVIKAADSVAISSTEDTEE